LHQLTDTSHTESYALSRQQTLKSLKDTHDPSLVSEEEAVFFSAAADATIRCWSDRDCVETHQLRDSTASATAEMCVMEMLWSLNCVATGYESGKLSLWHADSGSKTSSFVLTSRITALIEASNAQSQLLYGADISGRISVWNLTLYKMSPSHLATDRVFTGYHDSSDPGILCLAFHR
jgi:WD40 repeat protein